MERSLNSKRRSNDSLSKTDWLKELSAHQPWQIPNSNLKRERLRALKKLNII